MDDAVTRPWNDHHDWKIEAWAYRLLLPISIGMTTMKIKAHDWFSTYINNLSWREFQVLFFPYSLHPKIVFV